MLAARLSGAFYGLVSATVIGLAVNKLLEACLGTSAEEELLDGFPRSRWLLSAAIQALVFPLMVSLSLRAACGAGLACSQWLVASSAQLPSKSLWYVYALFGSQSRDMCPMPADTSFLMKVHHWVVTVACVLSLFAPKGFGLFIAGTFVLELGSLFYNLRVLYPGNQLINILYQVCMPVSNLAALAGGVLLLSMPEVPLWMKALYFTADVGVCLGRQRHALKDAGLLGKKASKEADSKAASGVAVQGVGTRQPRRFMARGWSLTGALVAPVLFRASHQVPRAPRAPAPRAPARDPRALHRAGPARIRLGM